MTTYRGYRITNEARYNRDTGRSMRLWVIHHPQESGRTMVAKSFNGAKTIVDAMFREVNRVSF